MHWYDSIPAFFHESSRYAPRMQYNCHFFSIWSQSPGPWLSRTINKTFICHFVWKIWTNVCLLHGTVLVVVSRHQHKKVKYSRDTLRTLPEWTKYNLFSHFDLLWLFGRRNYQRNFHLLLCSEDTVVNVAVQCYDRWWYHFQFTRVP